jgi:hypothetical protein
LKWTIIREIRIPAAQNLYGLHARRSKQFDKPDYFRTDGFGDVFSATVHEPIGRNCGH